MSRLFRYGPPLAGAAIGFGTAIGHAQYGGDIVWPAIAGCWALAVVVERKLHEFLQQEYSDLSDATLHLVQRLESGHAVPPPPPRRVRDRSIVDD